MKISNINKTKTLVISSLMGFFLTSTTLNTSENESQIPITDGEVKMQTLKFSKGKLYELAFANIIPEKMDQLNNEYFPKAMPFTAKYGAKMLGGFGVVQNESKLLPSNMVAIFEWPNAQARSLN